MILPPSFYPIDIAWSERWTFATALNQRKAAAFIVLAALTRAGVYTIPGAMTRCAAILTGLLIVTGCQSENWGPYSSPRVSGEVFAADTQQPLSGVSVIRGDSERHSRSGSPPKGGELMMQKAPIRTNRKGQFVLESERVLSIYRGDDWNQVRLRFVKPGYTTLQTNFSLTVPTNSPEREASLAIGRVFLQRAPAREESQARNAE